MNTLNITEKIEKLIAEDRLADAEAALTQAISSEQDTNTLAQLYFLRGRLFWRQDRRGEAITDYEHSLSLDPNSPAGPALHLVRQIMDFYNPDLLNP